MKSSQRAPIQARGTAEKNRKCSKVMPWMPRYPDFSSYEGMELYFSNNRKFLPIGQERHSLLHCGPAFHLLLSNWPPSNFNHVVDTQGLGGRQGNSTVHQRWSACPLILITTLSWPCSADQPYDTCTHFLMHPSKHSTVQRGQGWGELGVLVVALGRWPAVARPPG